LERSVDAAQAAAKALDGCDPAEDSLGGDAAIRPEHGIALGNEARDWATVGWWGNSDDAMDEERVLAKAKKKNITNPDRPIEERLNFKQVAVLNERAHRSTAGAEAEGGAGGQDFGRQAGELVAADGFLLLRIDQGGRHG
jgi:hypothetical protein